MAGDREEPRALCGDLPLEAATSIFFPVSEGGNLSARTAKWPKRDNHSEARSMCVRCPLLTRCLDEALTLDGHTFRGLSPEERAAFGGQRTKPAKARPVYLTRAQVVARMIAAGYPDSVVEVLAGHARRLAAEPPLAASVGASPDIWEWAAKMPAAATLDVAWQVLADEAGHRSGAAGAEGVARQVLAG